MILCVICDIPFVHHPQDWARNHSGDPEVDAALRRGEDPGLALVSYKAFIFGKINSSPRLICD